MLDFPAHVAAPGRRERQKRERRDRIEAAARAEFAAKGYEAATTRAIAERADVSIGTLFAYAPDKRALLAMVFRDELHAATVASFAAIRTGEPLVAQLLAAFRPRYALWGADPALSRHAVRETMALTYDGAQPPEAELRAGLVTLVRANQGAGRIRADADPGLVARVIIDIYLSENRSWLAEPAPDLTSGLAGLGAALELALRGVSAG